MAGVPNRANMRQKYWITTGGVGSFDNVRREHNIHTPQGRAAMRKAVDAFSAQTGKTAWAYTEGNPFEKGPQKVHYKKEYKKAGN